MKAYKVDKGYLKSIRIPDKLYELFSRSYSEDLFSKFVLNAMEKACDSKFFFEFTMFDDIDDFQCNRKILIEAAQGANY